MIQKIKIYIISISLCSACCISAQSYNINGTYSTSTTSEINLYLNPDKMEFRIYKTGDDNDLPDDIVVTHDYARGSISFQQGYIICADEMTDKKYKLKAINEELLKNYNIPFFKDTLYVTMKGFPNKDNVRYFGRWKNGKKDGYWRFIPNDKVSSIVIVNNRESFYKLYKDGKLIKTGELKDLK
uniref:hypothetical protein n=1 Tax=uncultured Dysgonomonas sp. TaxID=206096 RepID=UPI002623B504|nr:hypothetical protein [uncultured Dysgonomonas sp.]